MKDISVVNPPPGFTADQLLFHIYSSDAFTNPAIEYIIYSNANGGIPVMTNDEIVLLAKWLNAINQHFYIYCFRNSGIPTTFSVWMLNSSWMGREENYTLNKRGRIEYQY